MREDREEERLRQIRREYRTNADDVAEENLTPMGRILYNALVSIVENSWGQHRSPRKVLKMQRIKMGITSNPDISHHLKVMLTRVDPFEDVEGPGFPDDAEAEIVFDPIAFERQEVMGYLHRRYPGGDQSAIMMTPIIASAARTELLSWLEDTQEPTVEDSVYHHPDTLRNGIRAGVNSFKKCVRCGIVNA